MRNQGLDERFNVFKAKYKVSARSASQSSLNEFAFRSHERSVKSLRKVDFSKKN
jgi:hypothetical protein